ncbi:DNA-processing protein DprA [Thioalkalivibrio sp.]|uniref:DNA-processing protein DprA n=1 Tax=Thioalkalivibrio sp. TaxID=2093813 RepID=UPI0012D4DE7E|nr:DNA-processing protein DprA [Thioalkalivibrio sp.]TVP78439.1 MAG: DNA-processing protein DprA [Thioalkalivibrio sp.]
MTISPQAEAVLLLNAWFSKPVKDEPRPLTPSEYGRLAVWMKANKLSPEALLQDEANLERIERWEDRSITRERLQYLLGRSGGLGMALERWERAGLWVMIRTDADYPPLLKQQLRLNAPPVLFGVGNRALLGRGGIAVIGSRDASTIDLEFTKRLAQDIARQGRSIVSGGARGVDEAAMLGALEREGTVIGVIADQLLRAATAARYRRSLMEGNLVLISPFNPEARFDVGNAMARNRYIYCLSDAAVVVATGKGKGGTWSGATENLKHRWVPLWVRADSHEGNESGTSALVRLGAGLLPDGELRVKALLTDASPAPPSGEQPDLFDAPGGPGETAVVRESGESKETPGVSADPQGESASLPEPPEGLDPGPALKQSLYDFFLGKLAVETRDAPQPPDVLKDRLDVCATQLNQWLRRAVAEGRVEKMTKPLRYRIRT